VRWRSTLKTFVGAAQADADWNSGYRRDHPHALAQRIESGRETDPHYGVEKRASAFAGCRFKRKDGRLFACPVL
jgi:hypothetical protein